MSPPSPLACRLGLVVLLLGPALAGCGDDSGASPPDARPPPADGALPDADGGGAEDGASPPERCDAPPGPLVAGDPTGHPDPFGARAAGQARAGAITREADLPHGFVPREKVGDFALVNDRIGVVVEAARPSDGYSPFGGEIDAVDRVGPDGRFAGQTRFGETILGFGNRILAPDSVTVLADGSDGGPAVVRALGTLARLPVLEEVLGDLVRARELRAAIDYSLAPGSDVVEVTAHLENPTPAAARYTQMIHGLLHRYRLQTFVPGHGSDVPDGESQPWLGFAGDELGFAWVVDGSLGYVLDDGGISIYLGPSVVAAGCAVTDVRLGRVVAGGPDSDGLLRALGAAGVIDDDGRDVAGVVRDADGAPVPDARVHALGPDGSYLRRTRTDAEGRFSLHAAGPITLRATAPGLADSPPVPVAADAREATVAFEASGWLHVRVTDAERGAPMPARIQVIPVSPLERRPASWGVEQELAGRLWQLYSIGGDETVRVPAGEHDVIATHGFEDELDRRRVVVAGGETVEVELALAHVVDSTGMLTADFHIHSQHSIDARDPVTLKVRSAAADGLELPVSTEHEYVFDFAPVVRELGLERWVHGMCGSELSTLVYGHFGVFPLEPDPSQPNTGAVVWYHRLAPEVFDLVRALPTSPALIINHPRSGGSIKGYFNAAGYDPVTGDVSAPELWDDAFRLVEVFNGSDFEGSRGSTVVDWFSLLEHGRRVFAVGDSDSHHVRSDPIGWPRNAVLVGTDVPSEVTPEQVRDAINAGHTVVTGGILVTASTAAGTGPGDEERVSGDRATVHVVVQAPSWVDVSLLEVIVDGETHELVPISEADADPMRPAVRLERDLEVPVRAGASGSWVIFHARGDDPLDPLYPEDRRPFGVTNPIFLLRSP